MAAYPADRRARIRHHLERGLPSRTSAAARPGGRRRLHRARVRVDLPGSGREDDALVPRQAPAARLRRRARRAHCRRDDPQGPEDPFRRRAGEDPQVPRSAGGREAAKIHKDAERLEAAYPDGPHQITDLVLFATGRKPNTANLGLERLGVKLAADGAVIVDRSSKSSVDSIHAIGDVTNRINLTPVATAEAMWLARTLFRGERVPVDHANVPTAVFSHPNIATVGLSEEAARERFGAVDVYKASFRAL